MKSKKAEEYIKTDLNIFCFNKKEWETDKLEILPSGDFVDNKRRIHKKETHIPFVNYYKCVEAIKIAEEEMKEKAIKAFCQTVCGGLGEDCKSCKIVKTFIKELNSNV